MGRFLGPAPTRKELRALALMTLAAAALVLVYLFATAGTGRSVIGLELGADFPAFYLAGRILNEHPVERLYDLDLQYRTYIQIRPGKQVLELPYVYPPYVAQLFRPLARLPYAVAYLVWAGCSALMYAWGLFLLVQRLGPYDRQDREIVWCLALSYVPFLFGVVVGGQLSAIGFFAFAMAVTADFAGQPFWSGLALALCAYKPTLLPLVVPMLLLTRRLKVVLGMAAGAALIGAASYFGQGAAVWQQYRRVSAVWLQLATSSEGASMFPVWKFIDVNAFTRYLTGLDSGPVLLIPAAAAAGLAGSLLVFCWKSRRARGNLRSLHWGAALTTTLVVNVYVPIYDCTMAVIPLLIAYSAIRSPMWDMPRFPFFVLAALLYLGAWFAEVIAIATRIQIYTLILGAFAVYQLRLVSAAGRVIFSRANP